MKIKNFLALGLITVVSGISIAQTYNATAGTNGTTDIQSDYSMATGDGASVSVDVPLEFELPKKVAIALNYDGSTFTSHHLFSDPAMNAWALNNVETSQSTPSYIYDSNNPNKVTRIMGLIYTNAENVAYTLEMEPEFIHESDINSKVLSTRWFGLINAPVNNAWVPGTVQNLPVDSPTASSPIIINASDAIPSNNGGLLGFQIAYRLDSNTIDPTDRAGKYLNTATITVSLL